MQPQSTSFHLRPAVAMEDYDFLRSTYEVLLRAPVPNLTAINHAFEALEAAHARLQAAHAHLRATLLN